MCAQSSIPRTGQAVERKDAPLILSISLVVYLSNINAVIRETSRFVLPGVRIEGGIFSERQTVERAVQVLFAVSTMFSRDVWYKLTEMVRVSKLDFAINVDILVIMPSMT